MGAPRRNNLWRNPEGLVAEHPFSFRERSNHLAEVRRAFREEHLF